MEIKYKIILIIIALVLIAFLFPKPCGHSGTAVSPRVQYDNETMPDLPRPQHAKYTDCSCIGIKLNIMPFFQGAGSSSCFGFPTSYSCYYNRLPEPSEQGVQRVDIPCE